MSYKRIAFVLAMLLAFASLQGVCLAQVPDPTTGQVNDYIVGHNNKGPYALSWTNPDFDSIVVTVNGRILRRGNDFNVDPANGIMSFNSTLIADAIVKVSYRIIPGKSQRTAGTVSVPVTLNVFNRKDANLKVTGLYAPADPKNPDAGKTIIGVGGDKTFGASKVSSQIFLSQRNDASAKDEGSSLDRAAYRVATESTVGAVKVSGSYLGVGRKFAGEKEYGLKAGSRTTDMALRFDSSKTIQASATMQIVDTSDIGVKGTTSVVQQQDLVGNLTDTTKVSLSHVTSEITTASKAADKSTEVTSVKVEQKMGAGTNATVGVVDSKLVTGDKTENIKTSQADVTAKIDKVDVKTQVTQSDSDVNGSELKTNTSLSIPIMQVATIEAKHSTVDSEKTGLANDTTVSVNLTPLKNTVLTGTVANKTTGPNQQFQRDMNFVIRPTSYSKISGVFSQKGVNQLDDVTKSAALELTPFFNTQMSANYQYAESGARVTTVKDYTATSKPVSFISVSGKYRDREVRNDIAVDSTAMQVAVSPTKSFSLTGEYQSNPENEKGEVQPYKTTTTGMSMKIGTVALTAGYGSKEERIVDRTSDERSIGLNMPAFGNGKFTTGLKQSRLLDNSKSCTNIYSLGYQHSVGSGFQLSLTGSYTQYLIDSLAVTANNELQAQASLGLKF